MSVYERVLNLANTKGISIRGLNAALNFGEGTISKWSRSVPASDKLLKVAEYFGVTVDYLLTGETKEKPDTSVELSYAHLELINRIKKMSDEEVALFLHTLDAFQAMQRTVPPQQD